MLPPSPKERWELLLPHLVDAVNRNNWLRFDQLLKDARAISEIGKMANLYMAVFGEEDVT